MYIMATSFLKEALYTLIFGECDRSSIPTAISTDVANRAIHYDPELYPEPETFNPDRWLLPKFPTYQEPLTHYPNMTNYSVFGFGRRLCPGGGIAERSINIIAVRVSWACNIRKAVDATTGKEIRPPEYDCE